MKHDAKTVIDILRQAITDITCSYSFFAYHNNN